jgi:hypothetical protein
MVLYISGEISLNDEKALKLAYIDGGIPTINLKNVKMGHFAKLKRNFSAYICFLSLLYTH